MTFSLIRRGATGSAAVAALVVAVACQERGKDGKLLDTPTSGNIRVAVDETLRPIIAAHIDSFQGLYPAAKVRPT